MTSRLIGYARVSTEDQRPEMQIDALRKAGCDPIYIEHRSGADRKRPELAKVLEAIGPGDVLVVWKLDRLGRSLPHLIEVVDDLAARKVGFRSLTEAIDTTTPVGELLFHIIGALAQFERSLLRERTVAGLAAARAMGDDGKLSRSGKRLAGRGGRDRTVPAMMRDVIADRMRGGDRADAIADEYGIHRATVYRVAAEING